METGDQFIVDTDSVYPEFSDMRTSDWDLQYDVQRPNVTPKTFEDKHQSDQTRATYFPSRCRCSKSDFPLPRQPMRTKTIDERLRDMERAKCRPQPARPTPPLIVINGTRVSGQTIMLFFFLLIVLVVVCCYTKTMSDMMSQLKMLQKIVKKDK